MEHTQKTWLSPDGTTHNQTDYNCISSNWRSSLKDVHAFRGADCGTDHSLLGGKIRKKFKKIIEKPPAKSFGIRKLQDDSIAHNFCIEQSNRFQALQDSENLKNKWVNFKTAVTKAAETVIGSRRYSRRKMWISATTWDLTDKRKKIRLQRDPAKTLTTASTLDENYRVTNRLFKRSCKADRKNWLES